MRYARGASVSAEDRARFSVRSPRSINSSTMRARGVPHCLETGVERIRVAVFDHRGRGARRNEMDEAMSPLRGFIARPGVGRVHGGDRRPA
jgi:hypothetical protein